MEAILLFCCRSCLKSDKDTLYYDLLGLEDQNASADAIKKAYKKKSLELHPDRLARKGIQVTAEHNQQFQKLKEAYDVLSDPRKRRLYDQIGASGMQLIENPTQMDPMDLIKNFQSNTGDRIKIGIVVALIFCGILVLPILFCLKCDGKLDNSPWLAIWTPMWVVNAVMAISAILFIMEKEQDEYNGEDEDENKEKPEKIPITVKLMFAAKTFAFIFIQIFVLMRMDQEVEWSWFKVFIPWFIYEALSILEKLPTVFSTVPPVDPALAAAATHIDEETGEEATPEIQIVMQETERHRKLLEQATMRSSLVVNFLRIWFALFLAARLDEDNNWDWGVVMLPIWLYFAVELVTGYLFRQWGSKLIEEADIDMEALEAGVETDPIKMMKFQHGSVRCIVFLYHPCFRCANIILYFVCLCFRRYCIGTGGCRIIELLRYESPPADGDSARVSAGHHFFLHLHRDHPGVHRHRLLHMRCGMRTALSLVCGHVRRR